MPTDPTPRPISRRELLASSALGLGALAATFIGHRRCRASDVSGAAFSLRPRPPALAPRAKAVIMLVQNGGPSQIDLFDPKPELSRRDGQQHTQTVEQF